MTDVLDVAQYILDKQGAMTAMKLQKLCYYAQAWHLVWDEEPLFPEEIEAWANGPVTPVLYRAHRRQYMVHEIENGLSSELTASQVGTVEAVLEFYGPRSGAELSQLTHREDPWREAREGLAPGEFGNATITLDSMAEYYESLLGTSADG